MSDRGSVGRARGPALGRRTTAGDERQFVADRIRRLRDRLGLTWPEFDKRLGIGEAARRAKTATDPKTPFTAGELIAICRAFGARADYVVLGEGPMLASDAIDTSGDGRTLADQVHQHVIAVVAVRSRASREGVAKRLPDPDAFLGAVEDAATSEFRTNRARHLANRKLGLDALRAAIEAELRDAWAPVDLSPEQFTDAARRLEEGRSGMLAPNASEVNPPISSPKRPGTPPSPR